MNESAFTQTASIPRTAARCRAEKIGLSASQLRALCKTGQLKHVMMGNKPLIYWPNLLKFLENGAPKERPPEAGTIRRIEE